MPPSTKASKTSNLSPAVGSAVLTTLAVLLWGAICLAVASRVHLVNGYAVLSTSAPIWVEPFLSPWSAWLAVLVAIGLWSLLFLRSREAAIVPHRAAVALAVAAIPVAAAGLLRGWLSTAPVAGYWEPLWIAAWSGASFAILAVAARAAEVARGGKLRSEADAPFGLAGSYRIVEVAAAAAAAWWLWQSHRYYQDFMLGFNDFGHFTQRIASTAAGRGLLLESPVLPPFWDHFNPGLLLLVPLWGVVSDVYLVFVLQALCLAAGGPLLARLATALGASPVAAMLWGLAWLSQPVVGQMNLAFSYGWHPITLAIPLLLVALWQLARGRWGWATCAALLAMSMEEGVIVVVSLFAGWCGIAEYLTWLRSPLHARFPLTHRAWLAIAAVTAMSFVCVYRFSGLAEFQTGRFVALGDSLGEVLLSPVQKPVAFWGELFEWQKLAFVLSLGLPCFLPSLIRGWRCLLPILLPTLVLLVWDHQPASSLAFQYASSLLPVLWLATLCGSQLRSLAPATGALACSLTLSLFVGQLPYSSPTLLDVFAQTYGVDVERHRQADTPTIRWLNEQLAAIRSADAPALATGRIAAHLVGLPDIETVGQYLQRREQLAELADRAGQPLSAYAFIVLDRREHFQQSSADIREVEREARAAGFAIQQERDGIVVYSAAAQ